MSSDSKSKTLGRLRPRAEKKVHPKKGGKLAAKDSHLKLATIVGNVRAKNLEGKSLRSHDERKVKPLTEDQSSMVSQSLVNPLQVYRFRLGGYTSFGRSAGVTNTFLASDPSASGWNSPEWSTLSALFSEFRLVQLGIRITRVNAPLVTTAIANLAIASNLGTATNPGSYAALADNSDVTWFSFAETTNSGLTHVMNATDLNWSEMATPTVAPYAGAPGSIQFYADNGLASGTDTLLYQVMIWGIYDFRIRV